MDRERLQGGQLSRSTRGRSLTQRCGTPRPCSGSLQAGIQVIEPQGLRSALSALLQMEKERLQGGQLSEEERAWAAADAAVRDAAALVRLEASDEAKRMNQMALRSLHGHQARSFVTANHDEDCGSLHDGQENAHGDEISPCS